jgi:hypothetical protein
MRSCALKKPGRAAVRLLLCEVSEGAAFATKHELARRDRCLLTCSDERTAPTCNHSSACTPVAPAPFAVLRFVCSAVLRFPFPG